MKKKSKKLARLERNRISILTDDMEYCYLHKKYGMYAKAVHKHEIYFGRNRQLSMRYGCVVPLCNECHNKVRNNIVIDTKLKQECQVKFCEVYDEDFIEVFRRTYL